MELVHELKRCAAIERERDHSSEIFQEHLDAQEANMKIERERHLVELNDSLSEERGKLETLVQEVCSTPTAEGERGCLWYSIPWSLIIDCERRLLPGQNGIGLD